MANISNCEKKGLRIQWIIIGALIALVSIILSFITLSTIHGSLEKNKREFLSANRSVDIGILLPLTGHEADLKPGMTGFLVRTPEGEITWIEVRSRDITYVEDPGECRVRLESDQYSRSLYDGRVSSPIEFLKKTRTPGRLYVIGHDYTKYVKRDETR